MAKDDMSLPRMIKPIEEEKKEEKKEERTETKEEKECDRIVVEYEKDDITCSFVMKGKQIIADLKAKVSFFVSLFLFTISFHDIFFFPLPLSFVYLCSPSSYKQLA